MSKYQSYLQHKKIDITLDFALPAHWVIGKLRWYINISSGDFLINSSFEVAESEELNVPVVGGNGIMGYSNVSNHKDTMVVGRVGALCGNVHYFQGQCWITDNALVVHLDDRLFSKYAEYYLRHLDLNKLANQNAQPLITGAMVKDQDIYIPPFEEQEVVAVFLDHETAKIDTLIEKQQQLIKLLKEKRQAVISHAVTKGLNPNVPMKDSGVEWLGEVPAHWVFAKLKHLAFQIVDGAHFTPTYVDDGVPFLRVTDIQCKTIDLPSVRRIPLREHNELIKRCRPEEGDLLLSKNGTIGVPKIVDWNWEFSIFVSLCLIKLKPQLVPRFAEYFFFSNQIEEQISGLTKQSTVTNLHLEKIADFWFSVPSIEEQSEIVTYLDKRLGEFDKLIGKANLAISLMQERRTALISAAVTGKIDVRDWQPPATLAPQSSSI